MLLVTAVASMAVFAVSVLAPVAARDIGVAPAQIGLFTALVYIVAMFAGAVTGHFVARYGPIRVCQSTLLATAAGIAALTLASPLTAALSALLLGLAYGPLNPASAQVLARLGTPRWRPLIFSVKQTGVPFGGALAGALLPLLVLAWGWRGAALTVSLAALALLAALQPLRRGYDAVANDDRLRLGRLSVLRPLKSVFGRPELRGLTLVAFGFAGCQVSVAAFYVVYLVEALDWSLARAGAALAFVQAGGVGGRILWGALSDQNARRGWQTPRVILAGLGLLTASMLLLTARLPATTPFALAALSGLALGASSFGWNGVFLSEAAALAPPGRAGETTGGVQFVMFGGVVVVPPLFAAVVTVSDSYRLGFALTAVIALTAAAYLLLGRRGGKI